MCVCVCVCVCACVVCVCVCVCVGACRHLWASLIRECGWAKLLFLRSHFKAGDIEGLFLGRERVGLSTNLFTRSTTKQVDGDASVGAICTLESRRQIGGTQTKAYALMCRCVTL